MDIIIPLLIVLVLIGIPTWLMVRTMNKADKNTIVWYLTDFSNNI